jgi:MFS family permease
VTASSASTRQSEHPTAGGSNRRLVVHITIVICLIFFVFALTDSGWGPILSPLAAQLRVPLSLSGLLYVLWSAGYLPGALLGGTLLDRYGPRRVLFGAALTIFMGIAAVCLDLLLAHFLAIGLLVIIVGFAGIGGGVIDASSNGLISSVFAKQRGRALNLFSLLYPLSGVFIALVDATLLTIFHNNPLPSLLLTGGFIMLSTLSLLAVPGAYRLTSEAHPLEKDTNGPSKLQNLASLLLVLAPVIIIMMLTGSINSTLRTWSASYLHVAFGTTPALAAALTSITWVLSIGSRIVTAWIIVRTGTKKIAIACVLIAITGFLVMLFSPNAGIATAGIAIATVGLSPLFATCITMGSERVGHSPGKVAGILLFASGICGVIFIWLFGLLLNDIGAFWAILLCLVVVAISAVTAVRFKP